DRLPERLRDAAHALEEDGIVPLEEPSLRPRLHRVSNTVEANAVALLRDLGERSPDLDVRPFQDEVTDLEGVLRTAGDDTVLLDDPVRRGGRSTGGPEGCDEPEKKYDANERTEH